MSGTTASYYQELTSTDGGGPLRLGGPGGEQVGPVGGEEEDECPTDEEFFPGRDILEAQSGRAGRDHGQGIKVEDQDGAIGKEGERVEEK